MSKFNALIQKIKDHEKLNSELRAAIKTVKQEITTCLANSNIDRAVNLESFIRNIEV